MQVKLQTDRKIEISPLVEEARGRYRDAKDPADTERNAPAIIEGKEFAPPIDAKLGDLFLVKVLE
jgi:hypothetical protein